MCVCVCVRFFKHGWNESVQRLHTGQPTVREWILVHRISDIQLENNQPTHTHLTNLAIQPSTHPTTHPHTQTKRHLLMQQNPFVCVLIFQTICNQKLLLPVFSSIRVHPLTDPSLADHWPLKSLATIVLQPFLIRRINSKSSFDPRPRNFGCDPLYHLFTNHLLLLSQL